MVTKLKEALAVIYELDCELAILGFARPAKAAAFFQKYYGDSNDKAQKPKR